MDTNNHNLNSDEQIEADPLLSPSLGSPAHYEESDDGSEGNAGRDDADVWMSQAEEGHTATEYSNLMAGIGLVTTAPLDDTPLFATYTVHLKVVPCNLTNEGNKKKPFRSILVHEDISCKALYLAAYTAALRGKSDSMTRIAKKKHKRAKQPAVAAFATNQQSKQFWQSTTNFATSISSLLFIKKRFQTLFQQQQKGSISIGQARRLFGSIGCYLGSYCNPPQLTVVLTARLLAVDEEPEQYLTVCQELQENGVSLDPIADLLTDYTAPVCPRKISEEQRERENSVVSYKADDGGASKGQAAEEIVPHNVDTWKKIPSLLQTRVKQVAWEVQPWSSTQELEQHCIWNPDKKRLDLRTGMDHCGYAWLPNMLSSKDEVKVLVAVGARQLERQMTKEDKAIIMTHYLHNEQRQKPEWGGCWRLEDSLPIEALRDMLWAQMVQNHTNWVKKLKQLQAGQLKVDKEGYPAAWHSNRGVGYKLHLAMQYHDKYVASESIAANNQAIDITTFELFESEAKQQAILNRQQNEARQLLQCKRLPSEYPQRSTQIVTHGLEPAALPPPVLPPLQEQSNQRVTALQPFPVVPQSSPVQSAPIQLALPSPEDQMQLQQHYATNPGYVVMPTQQEPIQQAFINQQTNHAPARSQQALQHFPTNLSQSQVAPSSANQLQPWLGRAPASQEPAQGMVLDVLGTREKDTQLRGKQARLPLKRKRNEDNTGRNLHWTSRLDPSMYAVSSDGQRQVAKRAKAKAKGRR